MRRRSLLVFLLALLCACGAHAPDAPPPERVLFVGNSLTYVGNTPAVFAALSGNGGHAVASDMIVAGGATLAQRVQDGSVAHALDSRRYAVVVLQERGGDLLCAFGPDSCSDSTKAIGTLVAIAKAHGARAVLLGTYQAMPKMSAALVQAESAAAADAGIPYAEVSETLQQLQARMPADRWLAPDGMHPGPDLALLNAIVLYRAIHHAAPATMPLAVRAPIYGIDSGLVALLRTADAAPPRPDTPSEASYPADVVAAIVSATQSR